MTETFSRTILPALNLAIGYTNRGWPVFPCNSSNKQPLTPNGFKAATTDTSQVTAWWSKYSKAMIGMPTGAASGIWVLDIDMKPNANGAEELAKLEQANFSLPATMVVSTPSGGKHYYFKHVDGVRNRGSFEPGIDVRGEGGYVILPGSVRDDGGRYEWKSDVPAIADAPDWLLAMVKRSDKPVERTKTISTNPNYSEAAISDEVRKLAGTRTNRNNQLNDSAMAIGQFVGAGEISRKEAEDRLYGAAVANGYVHKDGEKEARSTIKSGLDAGERNPRDIPESELDGLPQGDSGWVERWVARLRAARDKPRFQITWFYEVDQTVVKEEIVKGFLGSSEFSLLVAKPGTAKSVLMVDIGCHIAAGMDWHGRQVQQGLVVFFAAERKKLTERRIAAWRKKHGVAKVPFVVVGGKLDLTSGLTDADALAKTIKKLEQQSGHRCTLIILDTVTRTFGPGDQHQSKDMSRYIQSVDALSRATNAHVAAIHHSTWSEDRGKGAIDLDGAIDASFGVKATGKESTKVFTLECTGSNDGEEGMITTFKLESVPLGTDADGNATTAPVVVQTDVRVRPPKQSEMALGSLEKAIGTYGELIPDNTPGFPEGIIAVKTDVWRNQYYADCRDHEPNVSDDTLRKRYERATTDLTNKEKVRSYGQWSWIVNVTMH